MNGHDRDINHALQGALVDRLGSERYQLWIGDHTDISVVDDRVVVRADHLFRVDRLRRLLDSDLREVAGRVVGAPVTVEYQVAERVAGPPVEVSSVGVAAGGGEPIRTGRAQPRPAQRPTLRLHDTTGTTSTRETQNRRNSRRFASLDTFVVGASNQLAHRAAIMAAEHPGNISPLVIHGPVGCGKTHLLEGIWSCARRSHRAWRVVYLSAEQFTSYFVEALRETGLPSFRRKYRDVEVLIIDDLQFFVGKRATIVELLYTVDAVTRDGRQLVLAADRPPAELSGLGEELVARLSSGLVCGVEPLDYQVRLDLCGRWAAIRGLDLSDDLLHVLATETPGDARRIAGVLNSLWAVSQANGQRVDRAILRRVLSELFPTRRRMIHLADVERVVCTTFGIEPQRLRSDGKSRELAQPRMLAMWLARKHTRAGLSEISQFFGRRSHSTVLSARTKVDQWVEQGRQIQTGRDSQNVREVLSRLEGQLSAG